MLENFNLIHAETDYLLSYPGEIGFDVEQESRFLERRADSQNEIELLALADGKIVGTAGIGAIGAKYKVVHRAEFWHQCIKRILGTWNRTDIDGSVYSMCKRCRISSIGAGCSCGQ